MTKRCIHLASGAVFLRCATAFFVLRELIVWRWVQKLPIRPGLRVLVFLFKDWATPHSLLYALLFAAVVTLLLDLWVRLVLRPMVGFWHAPRVDGSAGLFHLAANEWVVESSPGRRKSGWRWPAGALVRTNLRLWFVPRAHDAEIASQPLGALREARLEPAPTVAWGYILGWPDRVALRFGDVDPAVFAVPDPDAVLAWFAPDPAGAAPRPAGPTYSTPTPRRN
jgi:hypothetical protein